MRRVTALLGLALLLPLAACQSNAAPKRDTPVATPAVATRSASTPTWRGGYAFVERDTAHAQVLASAQRTGRRAVLFFWTSW